MASAKTAQVELVVTPVMRRFEDDCICDKNHGTPKQGFDEPRFQRKGWSFRDFDTLWARKGSGIHRSLLKSEQGITFAFRPSSAFRDFSLLLLPRPAATGLPIRDTFQ